MGFLWFHMTGGYFPFRPSPCNRSRSHHSAPLSPSHSSKQIAILFTRTELHSSSRCATFSPNLTHESPNLTTVSDGPPQPFDCPKHSTLFQITTIKPPTREDVLPNDSPPRPLPAHPHLARALLLGQVDATGNLLSPPAAAVRVSGDVSLSGVQGGVEGGEDCAGWLGGLISACE